MGLVFICDYIYNFGLLKNSYCLVLFCEVFGLWDPFLRVSSGILEILSSSTGASNWRVIAVWSLCMNVV
jgi:hypothetical protein